MAKLYCEFIDDENKFSPDMTEKLVNALNIALNESIKPEFDVSVTVTVVDCEEIRRLNKETRNTDKVTDVLSFPMLEFLEPCVFLEELHPWDYIPENNSVFMGDIILCKEKIEEQAEEYGHTFLRESVYLTLHGLLHIFGYDHIEEDDKKIMRKKEKEILKILEI